MTEKCLYWEISQLVMGASRAVEGPVPVQFLLKSLVDVMADLIAAVPDEDARIEFQAHVEEYLDASIDVALEKIKELRARVMQHQETVH